MNTSRTIRLALVALLLAAAGAFSTAPAAWADPDVCTVNASNPRSLTIQQAVDSGCSRILIAPGTYFESVVIPEGRTVSITGVAGAQKTIVDGSRDEEVSDRELVFFISQNATVTLRGLTIQNGGGGQGGGISNHGTLTLENSVVQFNYGFHGGGIYNDGTLTLTKTLVTNNQAFYGGGLFNYGYNGPATATLIDSIVTYNYAIEYGGGIENLYGKLTLINTSVTDNYPNNISDLFPAP